MSIKSKTKGDNQSLNDGKKWLSGIAESLLSLPRSVKRAILLISDFILSCACLFLALSLRYGHIEHDISPIILCLYAMLPIAGLYVIGFYKGVARGFLDTVMGSVAQLFLVLIVIYQVIIYLNPLEGIPRSVPIIFMFMFFIGLWNSRLTIRELLIRCRNRGIVNST